MFFFQLRHLAAFKPQGLQFLNLVTQQIDARRAVAGLLPQLIRPAIQAAGFWLALLLETIPVQETGGRFAWMPMRITFVGLIIP